MSQIGRLWHRTGGERSCLIKHNAVLHAAVISKPGPKRGNTVKTFMMLTPGAKRDRSRYKSLIAELRQHVRDNLAPYEHPKKIEFIGELPRTTTGKLQCRMMLDERRTEPAWTCKPVMRGKCCQYSGQLT